MQSRVKNVIVDISFFMLLKLRFFILNVLVIKYIANVFTTLYNVLFYIFIHVDMVCNVVEWPTPSVGDKKGQTFSSQTAVIKI